MRLTTVQLADFHAQGFLVLPALYSRTEVDILRAEVPGLFAEDTPANAQTRFARPDYKHHRDFTPVAPLADDCLLTVRTGVTT